jgi:DNA-directed RNA polymerase subunit K/omega
MLKKARSVAIVEEAFDDSDSLRTAPPTRKTSNFMSHHEFAVLVAFRALKLRQTDAQPMIDIDSYDPNEIALEEAKRRLLNYIIRRVLPDGTVDEFYASEMVLPKQ